MSMVTFLTGLIKLRIENFQFDFTLILDGNLAYGGTYKKQYVFLKF